MGSRVIVVDDSALVRQELSSILNDHGGLQVIGSAPHGVAALELAEALKPDLITLDVQMPVMDGLTTLKHLMTRRPVATVMVSAFTRAESHVTFDCLRYGALDFVEKPGGEHGVTLGETERTLVSRLRRASRLDLPTPTYSRARVEASRSKVPDDRPAPGVLLVTGGLSGLGPVIQLLIGIPAGFMGAVVVCLDAHAAIVESLASYLAALTPLAVRPFESGETALLAGTACFVPASASLMVLETGARPVLRSFPAPAGAEREAVTEALFTSVAQAFGRRATAVLLSGSPRGTAAGVERVLEEGGRSLGQSPETALEPEVLELLSRRRLARSAGSVPDLLQILFPASPETPLRAGSRP